jgi:hypothetical protein
MRFDKIKKENTNNRNKNKNLEDNYSNQEEMEEELLRGKDVSYLNIWDKIPSYKDTNIQFGILKILILFAFLFGMSLFSYLAFENLIISVILSIAVFSLFLSVFRKSLLLSSGLKKHKYGLIDPFYELQFWQLDSDLKTLYFTNTQDLLHCGVRIYQITVIPENIQPNLNHFIKALHIAGIPFSYQVIQTPLYTYGSINMKITIYFSLSYNIRGILTKTRLKISQEALEEFSYNFESACIANLAHFRIENLQGPSLISAFRTLFLGSSAPQFNTINDFIDDNDYSKNLNKIFSAKFFCVCIIFILIFFMVALSELKFYWGIIFNISFVLLILWVFWREAIYALTQFSAIDKENDYILLDPFKGFSFYRFRTYKNYLFIHSNNNILTAISFFNIKYALPPQFFRKGKFIAHVQKFFRAVVSKQLSFTYTMVNSPLSYQNFEKEGLKYLLPNNISKYRMRERKFEREQWLDMRGGIWRIIGLFSVQEHMNAAQIDEDILKMMGERLTLTSKNYLTLFKSNLSNYEVIPLKGKSVFSGVKTSFLKSKFFRINGSHLNYLLLQGKAMKNLMEISAEFKKGIETRIAAEFNTPLDISNFITIGKTLNTEFLQEEVAAGFTSDQIHNLLITNGSFQERSSLLLKIVSELVKQQKSSIVFDYDGSFSALLSYFKGSRFENDFLIFSLGRNFQIDPFDSDIPYDKERDIYIDYIVDILAMVYKQRKQSIDSLRELLKEENFSYAEFLLDVKNQNVWEQNCEMNPIVSMLKQIREQPSVISTKMDDEFEGSYDQHIEGHVLPYQFIQNEHTIIVDLSIFRDLEPKVFMAFVIIAKIIFYMNKFNEEHLFHRKLFMIPNCDIIFDNYFLDRQGDYHYGKIMKLLQPLEDFQMGIIMTSNQIRYLHPNVFNYINNIISFKTNDTRDIAILQNQMNLQELHGTGYYSSSRKDSYQIEFLKSLKPKEILLKRSDILQPFPVIIHDSDLKPFSPLSQADINEYMHSQGYDLENIENRILSNAQKTLFEEHFKQYTLFLTEIIQFFSILQTLDNIGNLYKSKIKEELLKIIYPKAKRRFSKDKRQIMKIRDNLFDIFLKYSYIIEAHPPRASGSQSIRTSYAVGPQYQESLNDYYEVESNQSDNITIGALEQESTRKMDFSLEELTGGDITIINNNNNKNNISDENKKMKKSMNSLPTQFDIINILLDHASIFLSDLIDIYLHINKKEFEEAMALERTALSDFLVNFYCENHPQEKNEISELLIEKAATFLLKNIPSSLKRRALDSLLERCKLSEVTNENITQYAEEISELSDTLFEFFTKLHNDIRETYGLNQEVYNNRKYFEMGI